MALSIGVSCHSFTLTSLVNYDFDKIHAFAVRIYYYRLRKSARDAQAKLGARGVGLHTTSDSPLANLPPWAEKCGALLASSEAVFSGAIERFEGGWLLWSGNVCFVLFEDGTWTMF